VIFWDHALCIFVYLSMLRKHMWLLDGVRVIYDKRPNAHMKIIGETHKISHLNIYF